MCHTVRDSVYIMARQLQHIISSCAMPGWEHIIGDIKNIMAGSKSTSYPAMQCLGWCVTLSESLSIWPGTCNTLEPAGQGLVWVVSQAKPWPSVDHVDIMQDSESRAGVQSVSDVQYAQP